MSLFAQMIDYYKAMDARDFGAISGLVDPDCEVITPLVTLRGHDFMGQFAEEHYQTFPDMHHEVVYGIEDGDELAIEVELTGTNTGQMQFPGGSLPPTGKKVRVRIGNFCKFRDGKLIQFRQYYDQMDAFGQLGIPLATVAEMLSTPLSERLPSAQ